MVTGSKYTEFNSSTAGTGTSQTRVRGWPAVGLGGQAGVSSASKTSFLCRLSGPQNQGCEGEFHEGQQHIIKAVILPSVPTIFPPLAPLQIKKGCKPSNEPCHRARGRWSCFWLPLPHHSYCLPETEGRQPRPAAHCLIHEAGSPRTKGRALETWALCQGAGFSFLKLRLWMPRQPLKPVR